MKIRMAIGMASNVVTILLHAHHDLRILFGGAAHNKKCGFHGVISKDVQNARRMDWIRAVIDG